MAENKKKVLKPLCVYSLAFSLALPSLTGVAEAATYANLHSATSALVALNAGNQVGGV